MTREKGSRKLCKVKAKGIVFDLYGTLVSDEAVARACQEVTPDAAEFLTQWRAKQLEYTWLLTLMGKYRNFWKVTEQALEVTIRRSSHQVSSEQCKRLMEPWLHPIPYHDVAAVLPGLAKRYPLAILSNGNPSMLYLGLKQADLRRHFRWVLSAHAVKRYKPSPMVYRLAQRSMNLNPSDILFVSSNSFDVMGAKNFGFKVGWVQRSEAPLDPLGLKPDLILRSLDELPSLL